MQAYEIDPLSDSRWKQLVRDHPLATVFHSVGWLLALKRTYGYEPVVLTTSQPSGMLENGLVFCRVSSWLTGRRYVSLPFSDHCDLLTSGPDDASCLLAAWAENLGKERGKYAEIRPLNSTITDRSDFCKTQELWYHKLDLSSPCDQLFRRLHKGSTQRKIRRAEREHLSFEEGRSGSALKAFYRLLVMTRRRHSLPPPPRDWFENLVNCLGDQIMIRVAAKNGDPIAAILTLKFKDTLVYKYAGSDPRFHALGGGHALIWRAIEEAKDEGLQYLDLGRSDLDDEGLATFKDRWGAARRKMNYFRYALQPSRIAASTWSTRTARLVFAHMPNHLLSTAGKLLYRHVG